MTMLIIQNEYRIVYNLLQYESHSVLYRFYNQIALARIFARVNWMNGTMSFSEDTSDYMYANFCDHRLSRQTR